MDGNLQTLLGQMILLGDSILTSLDRALESDDLAKVHELVKQASEGMYTKAYHLICQRTQWIWAYEVMDVTTYPAWNGATVALLADETNQAENIIARISELLANRTMFNVCDGAKSREPNSAEKITSFDPNSSWKKTERPSRAISSNRTQRRETQVFRNICGLSCGGVKGDRNSKNQAASFVAVPRFDFASLS
jgi:hypothetical protein